MKKSALKKSALMVWPALMLGGCLMSHLEIGNSEQQGGQGGEGDTSSETQAKGGRPATGGTAAGEAGDTSVLPRGGSLSGGGTPSIGGTPSTGGSIEFGGYGGDETGGTTSGGTLSTGGSMGPGGSGGSGGASGGSMSGGGMSGGGMTNGGAGGASGGSGGASGGAGGSGGATGSITDVWPSSGCNKQYTGVSGGMAISVDTWGQKDANCADTYNAMARCGLWGQAGSTWQTTPVQRNYYVNLPGNYDKTKAYPLILEGPGCGGNGTQIYPLPDLSNTAIRLGWSPPPNYVGNGTNPGQGCFDDKEGDDSVDFVFWEKLYDKVESELCFDRNRVFVAGNSSGSWIGNELVCKYAGDAKRPVRAVLANTGGLPTDPKYVPTCTKAPMAGMWVHEINDPVNPFTGNKVAINRAMQVNGCSGAKDYDTAVTNNELADYPIGGGNADSTCKKILNCPANYPLVVCALPGNAHATHDTVVNPGFATFVTSLMAP